MSSVDASERWDSALGHEGCQAANSKSTDPQQQNADDRNRSVHSAVRSTCAEWQSADVDDQWRLLLAYNCPSSTKNNLIQNRAVQLLRIHRTATCCTTNRQRIKASGVSVLLHTCVNAISLRSTPAVLHSSDELDEPSRTQRGLPRWNFTATVKKARPMNKNVCYWQHKNADSYQCERQACRGHNLPSIANSIDGYPVYRHSGPARIW